MVDKNLIVDTISQIGSVALDAARDNAIDNVNEEVNQALAFERKQERKHIARVFAEQLRSQSPSVREGVKTASHTFCLASAGPVYIA